MDSHIYSNAPPRASLHYSRILLSGQPLQNIYRNQWQESPDELLQLRSAARLRSVNSFLHVAPHKKSSTDWGPHEVRPVCYQSPWEAYFRQIREKTFSWCCSLDGCFFGQTKTPYMSAASLSTTDCTADLYTVSTPAINYCMHHNFVPVPDKAMRRSHGNRGTRDKY